MPAESAGGKKKTVKKATKKTAKSATPAKTAKSASKPASKAAPKGATKRASKPTAKRAAVGTTEAARTTSKTTRRAASKPTGALLRVRQVRSAIGRRRDFRRTLEALGIRHHQGEVVVKQNPAIDGMLNKVRHLVRVTPEE